MTDRDLNVKRFGEPFAEPSVSAVIVTYNSGAQLYDCLDSLRDQDYSSYEIILVNNGYLDEGLLTDYDLYYVALDKNYGPSYARNVGAQIAKGSLIAFLDDDAIADKQWLRTIANRFNDSSVVALRGKVLPKRDNKIFNLIAFHYDLGRKVKPWYLDIEGNSAVRTTAFIDANGFDSALFGAEGLDLSRKLDDDHGGRVLYDPSILIYHNYANSLMNLIRKSYRHGRNETLQNVNDRGLESYQRQFYERKSVEGQAEKRARFRTKARVMRGLTRLSRSSDGQKKSLWVKTVTVVLYVLAWLSDRVGKLSTKVQKPLRAKRGS